MKDIKTYGKLELVKEADAAEYLGYSKNTLKQSRCSGNLAGSPAPKFLKMGYTVRYKLSSLDEWLDQFNESVPFIKSGNDNE